MHRQTCGRRSRSRWASPRLVGGRPDAARTVDTTPFAEAPVSELRRASLRGVYLQRLQRLQRLRHEHEQELNRQGLRLLDRSVFAAYCACRDAGAAEEARKILRKANSTPKQPTRQLDMANPGPRPQSETSSRGAARGARPEG